MITETTPATGTTDQLPTGGLLRVYRCQCDELRATVDELPPRCPGHNTEAILNNAGDAHEWIPDPSNEHGHMCPPPNSPTPDCPPPDQDPLPIDHN